MIKDVFETILLLFLSFLLYFVFFITFPFFREAHGLLVNSELSTLSRSGFVKQLMFGSAAACALMGALMISWAPRLTASTVASLWMVTYFFIWSDTVIALFNQSLSYQFLLAFGLALTFIFLFFLTLHFLGVQPAKPKSNSEWKANAIHYWTWGWMCFYFGLSILLAYHSLFYSSFHWPLALGAMLICFLNYLLVLFLRKSEGQSIDQFSRIGRVFFTSWLIGLVFVWSGQKWFF
jgi:hypothetical protein